MKTQKIYIAGHQGMVGSAITKQLTQNGYTNLLVRTHAELELTDQKKVTDFLSAEKPDFIFLAAAKVGGIYANNTYRAEFIYQNLMLQTNIIHAAWQAGIQRLLFLGAGCLYPRECEQPIREEHLLTGPLEPTNEPYAIAKIAGIKMCESYNKQYGTQYITVMPTSLYGPNDHYDLQNCHVLPALIRKCHEAKMRGDRQLDVWGTGSALRDFLYVEDMAKACLHLMASNIGEGVYNVGSGNEISIRELSACIKSVVGFEGELIFDTTKPDGTLRRFLDVKRINELGWKTETELYQGLEHTYQDFLSRNI